MAKKSSTAVVKLAPSDKGKWPYWASKINVLWRKTAEQYIEMGRLLAEAKATMPASEWKILIDSKLEFDETKAKKLMRIAANEGLTKSSNLNALPASFTTLYTLSQLEPKEINKAIARNDITPNMDGEDASDLVDMINPKEKPAKPSPIDRKNATTVEPDDDDEDSEGDGDGEGEESDDDEDEDEDEGESVKLNKVNRPKPKTVDSVVEGMTAAIHVVKETVGQFEEAAEQFAKPDKPVKLPKAAQKEIDQLIKLMERIRKAYA